MDGDTIRTKTNNHGGILGGITSGMPLIFKAAVKPTPSIGLEQDSVSLSKRQNEKLQIHGRHDPCIVPRAVPCIEAAAAVALCDILLES
jgi:chorismate synthase